MSVTTIGTCKSMCPEREMKMREKEGLLHRFEVIQGTEKQHRPKADPQKIVKSFTRSAAGQQRAQASELRPPLVLKETVFYLLFRIVPLKEVPWTVVYDFVFDRLRAVRQDMVMQNMHYDCCMEILEPIIRFHAYAGYRLCEEPIEKFDPKINWIHLLECLKRLLVMYDECGTSKKCSKYRSEMEALYLSANLGNPEAIMRALQLKPECRTKLVNLALNLSLAHWMGNYVRVTKLLPKLPILLSCVVVRHVPALRRHALMVMSTAFNNRQYPLSHLQTMLLYNSMKELQEDCQHFSISIQGDGIVFKKGTFNTSAYEPPIRHMKHIDDNISKCNIPDLLLGKIQFEDGQLL